MSTNMPKDNMPKVGMPDSHPKNNIPKVGMPDIVSVMPFSS